MNQQTSQVDRFSQQLQTSLRQATERSPAIRVAEHADMYTIGEQDTTVYFIESGQIKLVMLTPDGRECLLAILTSGDIFGELCLAGLDERRETATAMTPTVVRVLPCARFLMLLSQEGLLQGFIRYLAVRLTDQQKTLVTLLSADSEQCLDKTLLHLAHKLGKPDPHSIPLNSKLLTNN